MGVYNGADYLRDAMESVLSQTGINYEFVIVNDGSTDDTAAILAEYQADQRVRVIEQENQGLTAALIRGCAEARADLIARQDADDVSLTGRLAALVKLLREHPNSVMASSLTQNVGPKNEPLFVVERSADPEIATHKLLDERCGPPAHGSVMFRRSAYEKVGGYRIEFYYGQDSDLWLRLARIGQIVYAQQVYYVFRRSQGSISGSARDFQREFGRIGQECHKARMKGMDEAPFLGAAEELRRQVIEYRLKCKVNRSCSAMANYFIGSTLLARRDVRGISYLISALRANAGLLRAWVRLIIGLCRFPWLNRPVELRPES